MNLLNPQRLREWSEVHSWRNFGWLARDYACLFLVVGFAVGFHLLRGMHGMHWAWEVPVVVLAVFLMGILQHRIGLMGHEASHYLLLRDRAWNDRLANLLIFHPMFSDIRLYRNKHAGHHLHPNHPELDPNLQAGRLAQVYSKFPLEKQRFARCFYLMFFWPPFVLGILRYLFQSLAIGVLERPAGTAASDDRMARLGRLWFILSAVVLLACVGTGRQSWPLIGGLAAAALAVLACAPLQRFGDGGGTSASMLKWSALQRLGFNALLLMVGALSQRFGSQVIVGYLLLWICPLIYVYPYLMQLREIYQHANAGTGDLDNTRIMHVDVFTRWALLGYGNDFHLIHHLYPNIPHDRLAEVHEALLRESDEYAAAVPESYGVVNAPAGRRSILDLLARKA